MHAYMYYDETFAYIFNVAHLLFVSIFSTLQVHINLILLEARLQSQLLYSLRAITRYMT